VNRGNTGQQLSEPGGVCQVDNWLAHSDIDSVNDYLYSRSNNGSEFKLVRRKNASTPPTGNSCEIVGDFPSALGVSDPELILAHEINDRFPSVAFVKYGFNTFYTMNLLDQDVNSISWLALNYPGAEFDEFFSIAIDERYPNVVTALVKEVIPGQGVSFKVKTITINPNGQDTVSDITNNLPIIDGELAYEPNSNGDLYFISSMGVFLIDDSTSSWSDITTNLPKGNITNIQVLPNISRIRAGVEGRGIWEGKLQCAQTPNIIESGSYSNQTQHLHFDSSNFISSTAVTNDNLVTYRAAQKVTLSDGFRANPQNDNSFHALISSCD